MNTIPKHAKTYRFNDDTSISWLYCCIAFLFLAFYNTFPIKAKQFSVLDLQRFIILYFFNCLLHLKNSKHFSPEIRSVFTTKIGITSFTECIIVNGGIWQRCLLGSKETQPLTVLRDKRWPRWQDAEQYGSSGPPPAVGLRKANVPVLFIFGILLNSNNECRGRRVKWISFTTFGRTRMSWWSRSNHFSTKWEFVTETDKRNQRYWMKKSRRTVALKIQSGCLESNWTSMNYIEEGFEAGAG